MTDPFRLDGRTVIVTGASRGIGAEVARAVAGQGGGVVLVARSKGALDDLAGSIDGPVRTVAGDVADTTTAADALDAAEAVGGVLWGLVNNAGINPFYHPVTDTPLSEWDEILRVNVLGAAAMARAGKPVLRVMTATQLATSRASVSESVPLAGRGSSPAARNRSRPAAWIGWTMRHGPVITGKPLHKRRGDGQVSRRARLGGVGNPGNRAPRSPPRRPARTRDPHPIAAGSRPARPDDPGRAPRPRSGLAFREIAGSTVRRWPRH